MKRLLQGLVPVMSLVAFGALPGTVRSQDKVLDSVTLYKTYLPSTVLIVEVTTRGVAMGTGALINAEKRLIITNYHVVNESKTVHVFFPKFDKNGELVNDLKSYMKDISAGASLIGTVMARDTKRDAAVVQVPRIPPGTRAFPMAAKDPPTGTVTYTIGNAGIIEQTFNMTDGKVQSSGVKEMWMGGPKDGFLLNCKIINATNPINQGDSGGPLFNDRGELVGISEGMVKIGVNAATQFVAVSELKGLIQEKGFMKFDGLEAKTVDPKLSGDVPVVKVDPKNTPKVDPKVDAKTPKVDDKTEKSAASELLRAKAIASEPDQKDNYIARLKAVIVKYPGTKAAAEAKKLLADEKR